MNVRAQDCIINRTQFQPHKPHADMVACGYEFLCSHVTVDAAIDADIEFPTHNHEIFAVEQENGVNFYAKNK